MSGFELLLKREKKKKTGESDNESESEDDELPETHKFDELFMYFVNLIMSYKEVEGQHRRLVKQKLGCYIKVITGA